LYKKFIGFSKQLDSNSSTPIAINTTTASVYSALPEYIEEFMSKKDNSTLERINIGHSSDKNSCIVQKPSYFMHISKKNKVLYY
jgi:hypothetical protein